MLFLQPRPHYYQFWFFPNSIDQAKIMKQYRNEVGLTAFAWMDTRNGLSFHHMDLTHGRKLSWHHTNSITGRIINPSTCPCTTCSNMRKTLDLPPHELNHREVHLSSTRSVTVVTHSSPPIQVECLESGLKISNHSNAAKSTSFPYCSMITATSTKSSAKYIQNADLIRSMQTTKLHMTLLSFTCIHP